MLNLFSKKTPEIDFWNVTIRPYCGGVRSLCGVRECGLEEVWTQFDVLFEKGRLDGLFFFFTEGPRYLLAAIHTNLRLQAKQKYEYNRQQDRIEKQADVCDDGLCDMVWGMMESRI